MVVAPTREAAIHLSSQWRASATVLAARGRVGDVQHLQAARFCTNADALVKLSNAVQGIDIKRVTPEASLIIANDAAYRLAWASRPPAAQSIPAKLKTYMPGQAFKLDHWHASVSCMLTGCTGAKDAVDVASAYGYTMPDKFHTVDDWAKFVNILVTEERAFEHTLLVIFVDAAGEFRWEGARQDLERQTKVAVRVAAGDDHEFVGEAEAANRVLQAMTEAAMFRARSGDPPAPNGAMLLCRTYQRQVLNLKPKASERASRVQIHVPKMGAPSVRAQELFLFWTTCAYHGIGTNPKKGVPDHAGLGNLVGFSLLERKYRLLNKATGYEITRKAVSPMNELELLRAGISAGCATTDTTTQVELIDLAPLRLLPLPQLALAQPKTIVQHMFNSDEIKELAVGARLKVLWKDAQGETYKWYEGTVDSVSGDTPLKHTIIYDHDLTKRFVHNLAIDRSSGRHPWTILNGQTMQGGQLQQGGQPLLQPAAPRPSPSRQGGQPLQVPPAAPDPKRMPTRSRILNLAVHKLQSLVEKVDYVTDFASDPVRMHNVCVANAFGVLGDPYAVANLEGLAAARAQLYADARDQKSDLCKATIQGAYDALGLATDDERANVARLRSDAKEVVHCKVAGVPVTMIVPRSDKEVFDAPDREAWIATDSDGFFESILALPGNELAAVDDLRAAGVEFLDLTTTRTIKVDAATGEFIKRKSRHAVDEKRLKRKCSPSALAQKETLAVYTVPIHALDANCFLSAVEQGDYLTVIDYVDAYGHGETTRAPRAVCPPRTLDARMPDGRLAAILLRSSLWGEGPAGYEFEATRNEDMQAVAWPEILGVPAMFYNGEFDRAIAQVDDILVKTRGSDAAALMLGARLSERCVARGGKPVKITRDAVAWNGRALIRSPDRVTLTISMHTSVESAVERWLPDLARTGITPAHVPVDAELRRLVDALKLAPDTGAKLTREQSNVQKLTGELRWMLNVVVHIVQHVHRLSCVAARAECPDAMRVALGTLAYAWQVRNCGLTYGGEFGKVPLLGVLRGSVEGGKSGRAIMKVAPTIIDGDAPSDLVAACDASWNRLTNEGVVADVYAFMLSHRGAAIHIELKNLGATGSSAAAEGLGILKTTDKLMRARDVLAALNCAPQGPTLLMSDSDPALRTTAGESTAARMRHELRRLAIVTQRVRDGACVLAHVPDAGNMVDWMTKWVKAEKLLASIAFLTGERSRVLHQAVGGDGRALAAYHALVAHADTWLRGK